MRKAFQWILSAAATIALITVFAQYSQKNREDLVNDASDSIAQTAPLIVEKSSAPPSAEEEAGYLLREYDGKLAIFKEDVYEPVYVFEVSMSTMSDYDKEALKEGIYAKNMEQLRSLVEDYTS